LVSPPLSLFFSHAIDLVSPISSVSRARRDLPPFPRPWTSAPAPLRRSTTRKSAPLLLLLPQGKSLFPSCRSRPPVLPRFIRPFTLDRTSFGTSPYSFDSRWKGVLGIHSGDIGPGGSLVSGDHVSLFPSKVAKLETDCCTHSRHFAELQGVGEASPCSSSLSHS